MKSSNLIYKLITQDDVNFVFELYSDWNVAKFLNRIPHPFESGDAVKIISEFEEKNKNRRNRNFVINLDDSEQKCGICVLNEASEKRAILGFSIHPRFQNKGIATEAAKYLIQVARQEGFSEVQASPVNDNLASAKVLTKLEFEIEEMNVEEESLHSGIRLSSRWIKKIIPTRQLREPLPAPLAKNSTPRNYAK